MDELIVFAAAVKPSIIALCESWLHEGIRDEDIMLPNYASPVRCDRQDGRKGGGVSVYIRNDTQYSHIQSLPACPSFIECLWIRLPSAKMVILIIYIPPNLTTLQNGIINDYIISCSDYALDGNSADGSLLVAGDLNQFSTCVIEETLGLIQIVNQPTRGTSILDKILIEPRIKHAYGPVVIGPNFGKADHKTVMINPLETQSATKTRIKKVLDYRQSFLNKFLDSLNSIKWDLFYRSDESLQTKCDLFYSILDEALKEIPFTFVEMSEKDKPWMTPLLKHLINCRYDAFRKGNFQLYEHYKKKTIKIEICKAKRSWTTKMKQTKNNLWNIVNGVKGGKKPILDNLLCIPNEQAADAISKKFAEYFSNTTDWDSVGNSFAGNGNQWKPDTSVNNVKNLLRKLKLKKSPGSDNLSPKILHASCNVLAGPIAHLYSLSVLQKSLPTQWKLANIQPIPKKKNPTINDLRPISLLPVLSKVLEKIVLKSIREELIEMYGNSQFGFRPHSSTLHAQIKVHEFITKELDQPQVKGVAMASFDLSRAFDRLNHGKLLSSLSNKLPIEFIQWCTDFLQGRKQRVCLPGNVYSVLQDVHSGVPQGCVLSPYLFAAHMGSLKPSNNEAEIIKYADDVVMLIPYHNEEEAEQKLNAEKSNLEDWCCDHGLTLNSEKSKVMFIDKRKVKPSFDTSIQNVTKMKMLGTIFQNDLKWNEHVNYICKAASQRIYLLKRIKQIKEITKDDLIQIYSAYVLGILEYNSPLFVALNQMNSNKLERIRQRCHRIVCGIGCQCDAFDLLSKRREERALKFFEALQNPASILHHLFPNVMQRSLHVRLPHCNSDRRKNSFLPYCSELYNKKKSLYSA